MKRLLLSVVIMSLAGAVIALVPSWGQVKNLSVNPEVTAEIRAFDPQDFFQGFDVYAAGVREYPTALLFDKKDDYNLPSRFWGKPLNEKEIVYAIHRLDDQYVDSRSELPFEPRALNVVNVKGEVLGYVYTSKLDVLMDRKKDGRVTVYRPTLMPKGGLESQGRGAVMN